MYYAPEIFKAAGSSAVTAFRQTVTMDDINLLFTFVAIGFVDRVRLKPFLIIGAELRTLALIANSPARFIRHPVPQQSRSRKTN
jgi:MFS transporter, SP family, arabinose:H+ symporter